MKLIVGLGNPGIQYAATRHNAGFRVVERIAAAHGWAWDGRRDRAVLAQGMLGEEKVILAKPQTYMNDSGAAVGPLVRFYKLSPATDLLVICDDLDLPLGRVRVRAKGSAGGQHGMESVISRLGTDQFARIRIGIGRPVHPRAAIIDHVLGTPSLDEAITLATSEDRAAEAALVWLSEGTTAAMNRFNAEPRPPKPEPAKRDEGIRERGERSVGAEDTDLIQRDAETRDEKK